MKMAIPAAVDVAHAYELAVGEHVVHDAAARLAAGRLAVDGGEVDGGLEHDGSFQKDMADVQRHDACVQASSISR